MDIRILDSTKADCFTSVFHHIKALTDNINVQFDHSRMYIQAMDSAKVTVFEISIPSTWFDSYIISGQSAILLGLNSNIFYRILSARDKCQNIQLIYLCDTDDKLYVNMTGEIKTVFDKNFEVPLIELESDLMEIPVIEYQAEMSLPSTNFASIVSQLKMFGDTMDVECSENTINLSATTPEQGKMSVEVKIEDLTAFAIDEGEELSISFSLNYLNIICLYNKLARDIELKLSRDYPMRVDYNIGDGASITFFLAPKIRLD
jgi:proliferating cell nuclear antigen